MVGTSKKVTYTFVYIAIRNGESHFILSFSRLQAGTMVCSGILFESALTAPNESRLAVDMYHYDPQICPSQYHNASKFYHLATLGTPFCAGLLIKTQD
jgi:hypothetical protein